MSGQITLANPTGDYENFTMRADGTKQTKRTSNTVEDVSPDWQLVLPIVFP